MSRLLAHQSGRSSDGIDYISRAIKLDSTNAEYWSNLAAIQMALGQWLPALVAVDQAMVALNKARVGGFDPALVALEIGTVLQSIGDLAGCVNSLEESLQLNANQPSVWLLLSRLVTASQYRFSAAQLQKMLRLFAQT